MLVTKHHAPTLEVIDIANDEGPLDWKQFLTCNDVPPELVGDACTESLRSWHKPSAEPQKAYIALRWPCRPASYELFIVSRLERSKLSSNLNRQS